MDIKLLLPVIIIILIYIYFCIYDIFKNKTTKYFHWSIWVIVCLISIPLGGIIYYFIGRNADEN